jgi:hypothetical protein
VRRPADPSLPFAVRLGLAFILAPFLASTALAATFTVSDLDDSGPGSLRQAVLDANASPGADDVVFTPGLAGTITLTSGEILIADSLTVHGPGAGALTVSGNDQSRIFHIESPADPPIDVTLSGLTLTHGSARDLLFGGAIFALNENLTILDSVISSSSAGSPGSLVATGRGGNVSFFGGTLRIASSTLMDGVAAGVFSAGGNVYFSGGRLILEQSTLSGGRAVTGGGLLAVFLTADSTIFASTISGNQGVDGGGLYFFSPGPAVLTIDSSTFSGNTAVPPPPIPPPPPFPPTLPGDGEGGGLFIFQGNVRIVDSTISGNQSTGTGGGLSFTGGQGSSLLLRLTTVSGNTAKKRGGSLLIGTSDEVELDHAIVANGSPQDLAASDPSGPPVTVTADYSLIENPGDVVLAGSHNLVGADPLLGPLADNGGPTLTHLPLPGSPVIDAGDPAIPSPPPADQRGLARIAGAAVDLGSVETGQALASVPALSPLGLALLAALLGAAGLRIQTRRRTSAAGPWSEGTGPVAATRTRGRIDCRPGPRRWPRCPTPPPSPPG